MENINDLIDEWHSGDSKLPLYEYLGMTKENYKLFLKGKSDKKPTPPTPPPSRLMNQWGVTIGLIYEDGRKEYFNDKKK